MEKNDDYDVVMAAVKQSGTALRFASKRLQDDEAIVLAAVNSDGLSLIYASDRLRDDYDVVLAAVRKDRTALGYASDRLRNDVKFCIECAKKNPRSILFFLGEVKELFEKHQDDIVAIEEVYTQQQADKALLDKIKKSPTNPSFKINHIINTTQKS
jgi:hypothetical protein